MNLKIGLRSLIVVGISLLLAGCGKKGSGPSPETQLSGTVTLNGDAVAGSVVFLGADNKPVETPLNKEGKYFLHPLPKGKYLVGVKGGGGIGGDPRMPKDMKMPTPPSEAGGGVPPPAKYADPKKSGLTFESTGDATTHDIELTK